MPTASKPVAHTPGPWESDGAASPRKYREGEHYFEIVAPTPKGLSTDGFNYSVADTSNRDYRISPEENGANARLIAAAPEMLAALEAIGEAFYRESLVEHRGDVMPKVWAAIQKARGGQ